MFALHTSPGLSHLSAHENHSVAQHCPWKEVWAPGLCFRVVLFCESDFNLCSQPQATSAQLNASNPCFLDWPALSKSCASPQSPSPLSQAYPSVLAKCYSFLKLTQSAVSFWIALTQLLLPDGVDISDYQHQAHGCVLLLLCFASSFFFSFHKPKGSFPNWIANSLMIRSIFYLSFYFYSICNDTMQTVGIQNIISFRIVWGEFTLNKNW